MFEFEVVHEAKNTVYFMFNQSKFSFIKYDYPLLENLVVLDDQNFNNIKIASLKDIGCMKLSAIMQRGYKRDFVDLFAILDRLDISLKELINQFYQKYEAINYSKSHIIKSLTYLNDANLQPELNLLTDIKWEQVKEFFNEHTLKLENGFDFSKDF